MNELIKLLPDSVANQIAAGEVVDRPSSVVKELMENALDAGASKLTVVVKDAGRTLIKVMDDGSGMSDMDARMAFERHATSKISSSADLYALHTMGFRGEALASIAAIAQVELKTRRKDDEVGTLIELDGSQVVTQEPVACSAGSCFSVKNLFYNTPARRRFLKSDNTEWGHIITIFNRIAIIYPEISFVLRNNNTEVYNLPATTLAQRIVDMFGAKLKTQLLPINVDTDIVRIEGYVCRPESASKRPQYQYFFANGRYMWHSSFNKAVQLAYDRMLPNGYAPNFFLRLDVDSATLDVNVHPQKIEVKFENEKTIWTIIQSAVREALGKFNIVPGLDFEHASDDSNIEIPVLESNTIVRQPTIGASPSYNPFKQSPSRGSYQSRMVDWEKLYRGFESEGKKDNDDVEQSAMVFPGDPTPDSAAVVGPEPKYSSDFIQFKNNYIITSVKSGLMIIDQHRAHQRVLYDKFMNTFSGHEIPSQRMMFPEEIILSADKAELLEGIKDDLKILGFEIEKTEGFSYRICAKPSDIDVSATELVNDLLDNIVYNVDLAGDEIRKCMALRLAVTSSVPYGKKLTMGEINELVNALFVSANPSNAPDGKRIVVVVSDADVRALF